MGDSNSTTWGVGGAAFQKRLSYNPETIGAAGGIRTPDTRFRRPMLYSAELQPQW